MLRCQKNESELTHLKNEVCETLAGKLFWWDDEFQEISVLLLKLKNGLWQRFFTEEGSLFWEELDELWELGVHWDKHPSPEDKSRFELIEIDEKNAGVNFTERRIEEAVYVKQEVGSELHLCFTGDITLVLQDNESLQEDEDDANDSQSPTCYRSLFVVINGQRRQVF